MLRLKRPIMIASVFVVDTSDETFRSHYLGDRDTPVCIHMNIIYEYGCFRK